MLFRSDQVARGAALAAPAAKPSSKTAAAPVAPATQVTPAKAPSKKLSFKEKSRLDQLPKEIAALEAEQASLNSKLADGRLYSTDAGAAQAHLARLAAIEASMDAKLTEWAALEG